MADDCGNLTEACVRPCFTWQRSGLSVGVRILCVDSSFFRHHVTRVLQVQSITGVCYFNLRVTQASGQVNPRNFLGTVLLACPSLVGPS